MGWRWTDLRSFNSARQAAPNGDGLRPQRQTTLNQEGCMQIFRRRKWLNSDEFMSTNLMKIGNFLIFVLPKTHVFTYDFKDANMQEAVLTLVQCRPAIIISTFLRPSSTDNGVRWTCEMAVNAWFTSRVHLTPLSIFPQSTLFIFIVYKSATKW